MTAILDYCDGLAEFPLIAFAVTKESVQILGIYYGGRDYETLLLPDA